MGGRRDEAWRRGMAIANIAARAGPGHQPEVAMADADGNRTNAMLSLAVTLPKVTRRTLGRHGLAEGGLVTDWAAVVGETIAERSLLLRLSFTGGERRDGTLEVRVYGALAMVLEPHGTQSSGS